MQNDVEQQWLQALRWVMTHPGLIEDLPGGHKPLIEPSDPRLDQLLQQDQSGLLQLLKGPRTHKVGIAFEVLILWGIEQALGYTCLGRDLQIQDGKRTMGALDLVVEAPDGAIEHWELAYKLFLQCDEDTGWASWLGPRGRDRLDAKLHKMLQQQLPMSSTPQAISALKTLDVGGIDRRRLMLQGVLFSPYDAPARHAKQGHQTPQGRWLYPSQLALLVHTYPTAKWVRRYKPFWFGPTPHGSLQDALSTKSMASIARTVSLDEPQLWTRISDEDPPMERMYFVVNEDWGKASSETSESPTNAKGKVV